jgi:hypothetical protein
MHSGRHARLAARDALTENIITNRFPDPLFYVVVCFNRLSPTVQMYKSRMLIRMVNSRGLKMKFWKF